MQSHNILRYNLQHISQISIYEQFKRNFPFLNVTMKVNMVINIFSFHTAAMKTDFPGCIMCLYYRRLRRIITLTIILLHSSKLFIFSKNTWCDTVILHLICKLPAQYCWRNSYSGFLSKLFIAYKIALEIKYEFTNLRKK